MVHVVDGDKQIQEKKGFLFLCAHFAGMADCHPKPRMEHQRIHKC